MLSWLDEVAGPGYSQAVLWALLALLVLVVLLVVIKLFRSMTFGTFVAGGRNRKNRLAVMDATAVDSHRRLVLVRRDDTEHLLLIGGATDIVVEGDIRIGQPRRPAPPVTPEPARETQSAPQPPSPPPAAPIPAPPPQPAVVRRTPEPPRPAPTPAPRPPAPVARQEPARAPSPAPRQQATFPTPKPAVPANAAPATAGADDLDDALLRELQVSLDDNANGKPAGPGPSLDDEMAKLLGELSNPRR